MLPVTQLSAILALNLKRLRKARGWTQEDLAERAEFSVGYLKQVETAKAGFSEDGLRKLITAFGCAPSELFVDPDRVPTPPEPTIQEAWEKITAKLAEDLNPKRLEETLKRVREERKGAVKGPAADIPSIARPMSATMVEAVAVLSNFSDEELSDMAAGWRMAVEGRAKFGDIGLPVGGVRKKAK
jgi:transcriptional regulator with XRE-family HTH domain